jgi:uncharacterized protein (TIGR03437 family)
MRLSGFVLIAAAISPLSGQMVAVNGASYNPSAPIAPGSFASIFGTNLCSQTAQGTWVGPGKLPLTLGGCSLQINGAGAMMQYVSPGQINFVMPMGVAAGQATYVVNNGSATQAGALTVAPAGPGVFTALGSGMGMGAMLLGTNFTMVPFSPTTNGQPTPVSIFLTGLDLSTPPQVSLGGMPMNVTWFGNAPGYVGLQQINVTVPAGAAGAGRAPVLVTSAGVNSNVTFMHLLPTNAMMQGMPGWASGMMVNEDTPRPREVSFMTYNPANNTVLLTDEADDAVRVLTIGDASATATITLPSGSQAHEIAVNSTGSMAAVSLSALNSVALIDLTKNQVTSVIGTGTYPSGLAFAGTNLLVANGGSANVTVIDIGSATVTQTVPVGFGPSGIAASGNTAVVANTQAGSLSVINLSNYQVATLPLASDARPREVAISTTLNKAVISMPFDDAVAVLDLSTQSMTKISFDASVCLGPGAMAVSGSTVYVAGQMTGAVLAVDLNSGSIIHSMTVDPGPVSLAVDTVSNSLLALSEGAGVLDVIDLGSYTITSRMNAVATERVGTFAMPLVSSISPISGAPGTTFTLTLSGVNLQGVTGLGFYLGYGPGGGMLGGGMMGGGMMGGGAVSGNQDSNIQVSNFQVSAGGDQITATVKILSAASPGTRQIRLQTGYGLIAPMMSRSQFTVTQ